MTFNKTAVISTNRKHTISLKNTYENQGVIEKLIETRKVRGNDKTKKFER